MTALSKAEMAEHLYSTQQFAKPLGKELVEQFFEQIRVALATGEAVKLSGFGSFELRDKKTRPGRNPKTGEEVPISARRVVTFHPGQKLKARIDECSGEAT